MSDQKIRDLMERMTAMSPRPPEFPGEHQTVTQPSPRRSGALVFAVAGLAVLALALPFVFWQGNTNVGSEMTTVPTETTIPTEPSTTRQDATTIPSPPAGPSVGWPVFLVQTPTDSYTGNPTIVSFYLNLDAGSDPSLLNNLTSPENVLFNLGSLPVQLPEGFSNQVPADVRILGKSFQRTEAGLNRITLDMSAEFLAGAGGLLADFTMLNQIIYTTLQFDVDEILFTVEGEPVEEFGSEGLSLLEPLNTESFIDELGLIMVTDPAVIDADGLLTVRGWANVFEATVSWHIDGGPAASPAHSGYVTATCGTGCWGYFEISEDLSDREGDWSSYELWIYTESPKDGSLTDLVKIPFRAITQNDR